MFNWKSLGPLTALYVLLVIGGMVVAVGAFFFGV